MDLQDLDYTGLVQCIAAARPGDLPADISQLRDEQRNATSLLKQSLAAGAAVNTASEKLLEWASGGSSCGNNSFNIRELMRIRDELKEQCSGLAAVFERLETASLKLTSCETKLTERLDLILPLCNDLASKVGIEAFNLNGLSCSSSSTSSSEELLHPALKQYFKALERRSTLQDHVNSSKIAKMDIAKQISFFEERGDHVPSDVTDRQNIIWASLSELGAELSVAEKDIIQYKANCESLNLDPEKARWRNAPAPPKKPASGNFGEPRSQLHEWLNELELDTGTTDQIAEIETNSSDGAVIFDAPSNDGFKNQLNSSTPAFQSSKSSALRGGTDFCSSGDLSSKHESSECSVQNTDMIARPEDDSTAWIQVDGRKVAHEHAKAAQNISHEAIPRHQTVHSRKVTEFQQRPAKTYKFGMVFKVRAKDIEPSKAKSCGSSDLTDIIVGSRKDGMLLGQRFWWFVVVEEGASSCLALRIKTNNGRGTSNLPLGDPEEYYSIVYTGDHTPAPLLNEEVGKLKPAIRISRDSNRKSENLDPRHRLSWTQVYEVQFGVRSKTFGHVHRDYMWCFRDTYTEMVRSRNERAGTLAPEDTSPFSNLKTHTSVTRGSQEKTKSASMSKALTDTPIPSAKISTTHAKSESRFGRGDIVDLPLEYGYGIKERKCRRLRVRDVKFDGGLWQYIFENPSHKGQYNGGRWVVETVWMVAAN